MNLSKTILGIFLAVLFAANPLFGIISAEAAACNASLLRSATMGQRGQHVQALQECLIVRGYDIGGTATGYYGAKTRNAVKAFYKSELGISNWNGLSVGPRARAILGGSTTTVIAPIGGVVTTGSLKRITSADELKKYVEQSTTPWYSGRIGLLGRVSPEMDFAPTIALQANTAAEKSIATGSGAPSRVSTTNVQVAGIDEPDIVKTDGTTIYF